MCLVCDVIILGMCLARYSMHIYDVIVLDIESSECDSEVKATEVLQFSGNFNLGISLGVKLRQHNFCSAETKENIQAHQFVIRFWGNS